MSSVLKKARLNAATNGNVSPSSTPTTPATHATTDAEAHDADISLSKLREKMQARSVSAYLVETQDAHQSEYVSEHDKRRAWLTGFNGSAGTALVTATKALLWTDGRYFLQAAQQLSSNWTLMPIGEQGVPSLEEWVKQEAVAVRDAETASSSTPATAASIPAAGGAAAAEGASEVLMEAGKEPGDGAKGFRLGVDPWLLSASTARSLSAKLKEGGGSLVQISSNLVDEIWMEQPPMPCEPVRVHPMKYAGESVSSKLERVRRLVLDARASSLVVMAMDEVAWLFNIRGSDISFNPVPVAAAYLTQDSASLFIDRTKLGDDVKQATIPCTLPSFVDVRQHLEEAEVTMRPYDALLADLRALTTSSSSPSPAATDDTPSPPARILMDPSLNLAVREAVPASLVVEEASPIALAKALKNEPELQGLREAHIRDGAAVTSFLSWLDKTMAKGEAGGGDGLGWPLTEYSVAEKLKSYRMKQAGYVSLSFETISGYGPNGAVIHYSVEKDTARALGTDSLYLVDSGAQYEDGTTDITRTLHFGEPTPHQRYCFTLVLKGHIALARATFPEGTMGSKLDVLARMALWEAGLDYRHGTGHGVGAFLNVHEGPHGIHCRIRPNEQGIKVGMTTSNEPGYYEDGNFGLRIENVCICVEKETAHNFAGRRSCTFETITMAPIQAKLIDTSLLTNEEREWMDTYHAAVLATLEPLLKGKDDEAYEYLVQETRPLPQA